MKASPPIFIALNKIVLEPYLTWPPYSEIPNVYSKIFFDMPSARLIFYC